MFEMLLLLGFFAAGMSQLLPPPAKADPERSREAPARVADARGQEGRRSRNSRRAEEGLPKSRAQVSQARRRAADGTEWPRPATRDRGRCGSARAAGKSCLLLGSATGRGRLACTR